MGTKMKKNIVSILLSILYIPASIVGGIVGKLFVFVGQFITDWYNTVAPFVEGILSGVISALVIGFAVKKLLKLENTKEVFYSLLAIPFLLTIILTPFSATTDNAIILITTFIGYLIMLKQEQKN